jgi:hypothetical protein
VLHARDWLRKQLLPQHLEALRILAQLERDNETDPLAIMSAEATAINEAKHIVYTIEYLLREVAGDALWQVWTSIAQSGTGKTTVLNILQASTEMSPSVYNAKFTAREKAKEAMLDARSQINSSDFNPEAFEKYAMALVHALECCLHEAKEQVLDVTKEAAQSSVQTKLVAVLEMSYQHREDNCSDAEFGTQYTESLQCLDKIQGYVTGNGAEGNNITVHTNCKLVDRQLADTSQEDNFRCQVENFAMDSTKIPNEAFLLATPDIKAGGRSACTYFNTTVSLTFI